MIRWWWAATLGVLGVLAAVATLPTVEARTYRGELTEPAGGAPFGGDAVGVYRISVRGSEVTIAARVDLSPGPGQTLEGWLVDMQTGYKLSLGALRSGDRGDDDGDDRQSVLHFEQRMVNVLTYGVLVITTEPARDLDPNPAAPVAGALLPAPFGQ